MKRPLASCVLFAGSLLVCLLIAEIASRYIFPVSPGIRTLDLEGKPISIDWEQHRLPPNLRYREVSQEFDVQITFTNEGHRVPAAGGNPHTVFLGDSFTFGTGLGDEQTFAALFCEASHIRCANLGRGGTGTRTQLDILEYFLVHEHWRPRQLKLFMLVMTSALMEGNDLRDNLREAQAIQTSKSENEELSGLPKLLAYRKQLLRNSNLARVIYFQFGPLVRTVLSPAPEQTRLDAALAETALQLERLRDIAQRYGFRYRLYLLYPMQDLLGGTHRLTSEAMRRIAPCAEITDTAEVLLDDPRSYYYPYDGHLNTAGAERIRDLLKREGNADAQSSQLHSAAARICAP